MRAVRFEKSWVVIGTPLLVTGFLKADLQIHLVEMVNGRGRGWAALDDGLEILFKDRERMEVQNWIDNLVGEDAVEVDYWNERGQYVGLPMFSPAPGPVAHRVARARRKAKAKKLSSLPKQQPIKKIRMPYEVDRGIHWD